VKLGLAILGSLLLFVLLAALPSAKPQIPAAKEVVSPMSYASLEPAARGSTFQLAVVLKIRNGFHINAHEASADYLIATSITPQLPAGFKAGEISYPKGELRSFSFSKTPLNVYEDKAIVRIPITVLPDAPTGAQHIPLKLRYQACNNELCLPPVKLDVDAAVSVAASPNASRPAHPELFPAH
jgi:DsbC/DsbD-like thiol-disulfide interchange protein